MAVIPETFDARSSEAQIGNGWTASEQLQVLRVSFRFHGPLGTPGPASWESHQRSRTDGPNPDNWLVRSLEKE